MSQVKSKKYLFLEPFEYENRFIEELKKTFSHLDYETLPYRSLSKHENTAKSSKIVVINWLEDQPSYNKTHFEALLDFLRVIKKAFIIKHKVGLCIWIQHNFRPHHREYGQIYFRIIQGIFKVLRFKKVIMENTLKGHCVTHPLYLSDTQRNILTAEYVEHKHAPIDGVLFFGAIKKYKNLQEILAQWPHDIPLRIIGRCDSEQYLKELNLIIGERKLNVTIQNRFISDAELDSLLKSFSWVLVPHGDMTMVASGSFYHAISYGCNIICNASDFGKQKSIQHNFVKTIDKDLSYEFLTNSTTPKQLVLNEVNAKYGEKIRNEKWKRVLNE